jgi:anti-anti-sigma regulatory factor
VPRRPVAIVRVIEADNAPTLCAQVLVAMADGADIVVCDVRALAEPDLDTVAVLARLQLIARRLGGNIWLRGTSAQLTELLCLVGLTDVLPTCSRSGVEVVGQAEHGKHRCGVEKEGEFDDPIA